jgi:hypothetical protein
MFKKNMIQIPQHSHLQILTPGSEIYIHASLQTLIVIRNMISSVLLSILSENGHQNSNRAIF